MNIMVVHKFFGARHAGTLAAILFACPLDVFKLYRIIHLVYQVALGQHQKDGLLLLHLFDLI